MLRTERLILRPWREADHAPFAALNADPEVRRYFNTTLTRAESDASAGRMQARIDAENFGFWAAEVPGVAPFVGFVGLDRMPAGTPLAGAVQIGWRLARDHWGKGYATEGARAALAHGFGAMGLSEIVAYTLPANAASRRVMTRIGMTHDPADDFHAPEPDGSFSRCVLYRVRAP